MYQHIIVPLDGSALSERALPHAITLAKTFAADVILVRAVTGPGEEVRAVSRMLIGEAAAPAQRPPEQLGESPLPAERGASAYLMHHAASLREQDLTVEIVIEDAPPAGLILEVARQAPGAVIVMTTHGRGGLGRLIFGSTAIAVLEQAPVPVLLIGVVGPSRRGVVLPGESGPMRSVDLHGGHPRAERLSHPWLARVRRCTDSRSRNAPAPSRVGGSRV